MQFANTDLTLFRSYPVLVDPMQGALIVIRPDGYVGHVVPLSQPEALLDYFKGFLISTKQHTKLNGAANGTL